MAEELSDELVADVMFAFDRTCCVCYSKGKQLQVHHIDENHNNNDPLNLAVVCKDCHGDIHNHSAFSRKFTPELVLKYRDHWIGLVADRRETALLSTDTNYKFTQEAIETLSDRFHEAIAIHREKEQVSKMMVGRMAIDVASFITHLIDCRQRNSDEKGIPLQNLRDLCETSLQFAVTNGGDKVQKTRLKQVADKLCRLFPDEDLFPPDGIPTCPDCGKGIDTHD